MALLPLLFGDLTRVAVLRVLRDHPEGLSQRAVSAQTGRAPSHINRVIQSLMAAGLVKAVRGKVWLEADHPLYQPVVETLDRFHQLEGWGRYLRSIIRAANERFGGRDALRYYVGGYIAATRNLQPIDFASDRCDLYVKSLTQKDMQWLKGIRHLAPYDVRLHSISWIKGFVDEDATIDDEQCLVAFPEVGAIQCLEDETFPRYGAFLMLVQGLDEWEDGDDGGYQPQRLKAMADRFPRWNEADMDRLIGHITTKGRRRPDPPSVLTSSELRELENAMNTVRGG